MKPDVIVCWPRNCDYPLWRRFIRDERQRFGRVLVVFTEHDGADYRPFVRANFPEAECFDSPPRGDQDWRDVAVNAALDRSDAEWVWFTEQDFLISNLRRIWGRFQARAEHDAAIGWWDGVRWHPSCLFVRRTAIERTSRYFGPVPIDHFTRFSEELSPVADLGSEGWEHLQGLSQNHWLTDIGEQAGIFHEERFRAYLRDCLASGVPLALDWAERAAIHAGRT